MLWEFAIGCGGYLTAERSENGALRRFSLVGERVDVPRWFGRSEARMALCDVLIGQGDGC